MKIPCEENHVMGQSPKAMVRLELKPQLASTLLSGSLLLLWKFLLDRGTFYGATGTHCFGLRMTLLRGGSRGGPGGPAPPLTTKNEAPAPKFYKTEAPEWQF